MAAIEDSIPVLQSIWHTDDAEYWAQISSSFQGIKELISALHSRGVAVYLISGGFREMTLPIARELGVPATNVFANRMNWQVGDVQQLMLLSTLQSL